MQDGNANTTRYLYDQVGNLANVLYPGYSGSIPVTPGAPDTLTYGYDSDQNVTSRTDGRGVVTQYNRLSDPESLITGISYSYLGSNIGSTTFSYDSFGRRTQMTDSSGTQYYSYDDDDDLLSLVRDFNSGPQNQQFKWQYNSDGSVSSLQIPGSSEVSNALTINNGSFNYSYDAAQRLTNISVPFTGGSITHSWFRNGWLKKTDGLTMPSTITPSTRTLYYYNARGFLGQLINYQYDPQGSLTQTSSFSGMTYDAMGNRLNETADIAAEGTAPDASRKLAFTYDTGNNPASSNRDVLLNESSVLTGSGDSRYNDVYNNPFSYDYAYNVSEFSIGGTPYKTSDNADNQDTRFGFDGNGNPTSYQGAIFTFDPEDRLTAISSPAFAATYDGDGLRASKTANGVTTYYLYDGSEPVVEEQVSNGSASISAVNLWAADGWRARYDAGSNQFFAFSFDPAGNRVQSQNSKNTLWPTYDTASYEAYGHRGADWTSNGVNPAPYQGPAGFGGEWGYYTDTETGLILLGHRYYDPGTGRFLNRDPSGYNGGVNLYGFAGDNPVNEQDPSGFDPNDREGYIDTDRVRFSQNGNSDNFNNGSSVSSLVAGLKSGAIHPDSIEPIRLVKHGGLLFSLDNRRLLAFHQAGKEVPYRWATTAEIHKDWSEHYNTQNGGTFIERNEDIKNGNDVMSRFGNDFGTLGEIASKGGGALDIFNIFDMYLDNYGYLKHSFGMWDDQTFLKWDKVRHPENYESDKQALMSHQD